MLTRLVQWTHDLGSSLLMLSDLYFGDLWFSEAKTVHPKDPDKSVI